MARFLSPLIFAFLFVAHTGFAQVQTEAATRPIEDPDVKQFAEAAYAAGLKGIFEGTGPFTVFAPSNAAFEKFGADKLRKLKQPGNQDALVDLILYHVIPGKYMAESLKTMDVKTVEGKEVHITVDNGQIRVNNAKVIKTNSVGPNGVMHEIDTVLVP